MHFSGLHLGFLIFLGFASSIFASEQNFELRFHKFIRVNNSVARLWCRFSVVNPSEIQFGYVAPTPLNSSQAFSLSQQARQFCVQRSQVYIQRVIGFFKTLLKRSSTVRNHDGACRQGFPHLMAFLEAHRGNLIALSNSCSPEDVVRLNLTFSSFPWANQMCVDFLVTKLSHTAPQTVQVTCTSQISNYGRVTSNFKVSPDGTGVPPVKPTPPNLPPNPPPNQNDRNPTGDWQLDGYSRSLEQYSGTWTRAKAAQLLNKIGFGATKAELDDAERLGLSAFVDKLVDDCDFSNPFSRIRQLDRRARELREMAPAHRYHCDSLGCTLEDYSHEIDGRFYGYKVDGYESLTNYILYHSLNGSPVCAAMWVILHNWFALNMRGILDENSYPALRGEYVDLIFRHLGGNFADLVKGMHGNPSMLAWLDNHLNRRRLRLANQNFAREFLELFTVKTYDLFRSILNNTAWPNYGESDVIHLTRGLVGYQRVMFRSNQSGQTCSATSNPGYGADLSITCRAKRFCRPRLVKIEGSGFDPLEMMFFENPFYSGSALNIGSETCPYEVLRNSEYRFAFNEQEWERIQNEDEEFRQGVKLFCNSNGQNCQYSDDLARSVSGLPINSNIYPTYIRHDNRDQDDPAIPVNPTFHESRNRSGSNGSSLPDLTDNVTDFILSNYGYINSSGSAASRALAVQLLGFFVGPRAARDPGLIAELGNLILQNGFNFRPVLKTLLKSELIFSPEHNRTIIKTPFEWAIKLQRSIGLPQQYFKTSTQNWFAYISRFVELFRLTGFPNLEMPSVFGVDVAGTQRFINVSHGLGFLSPASAASRDRILSVYLGGLSNLMIIGNQPDPNRRIRISPKWRGDDLDPTSSNDYIDMLLPKSDEWDSRYSAAWMAALLMITPHLPAHPEDFFSFYSPFGGRNFRYFDLVANSFDLSNPGNLIKELSMRLGVELKNQQTELLRNYFTRLKRADTSDCWDNFRDVTARINDTNLYMSSSEVRKRYFDAKFMGIFYALATLPEAWLK